MKKIFLASIFILFLGIVPHVFAATQGFTALAPIPGLTDQTMTAVVNPNTLATFLNNLYKYLIGLAAIIAVIQIIWAGLDMAYYHKDAVSAITDDKGKIKNAIFGLVLVLSPALVFTIINPSILNLSLNLPPIKTATSTTSGAGTGNTSNVPTPTSGCTSITSLSFLETALCANSSAASAYTCKSQPYLTAINNASLGTLPGLTTNLTVPDCKTRNSSGNCIDTGVTVYCEANMTVEYYSSTHLFGHSFGPDRAVVPSELPEQTVFANYCTNAGGVVSASAPAGTVAFLTALALNPAASLSITNGCSDSYGVTYNPADQYGVVCYAENLTCTPQ